MTQSRQSSWAPGDVLDYTPRDRWCYEGIAVVQENGRALDTYWCINANGLRPDELATARLRFRLADYREIGSEDEWKTYAPADRQSISSQHGLQWTYYVRVGAEPDLETQIANARNAVERAESELRAAEWRLTCRRDELAELEGARV